MSALPTQARVVICGGGIVGTSVAYHLAKRGLTDVILLDQSSIGSGTSWHGAGLVAQFRSPKERNLIKYSAKLYKELDSKGHDVGWQECGSLNIAQTEDRWIWLRRFYAQSKETLKCQLVTPKEIKNLHPLLKVDDLQGGVWIPSDGVAHSLLLCNTFVKLAKEEGVKVVEECKVNRVVTTNNTVSAVETAKGKIHCQYFVNCSGLWSHQVALNTDPPVRVPVHAALHTYITTKPHNSTILNAQLPFIQDYDGRVYMRGWKNSLLAGGYELLGKPVTPSDILEFRHVTEDWDRFKPLYQMMKKRIPLMEQLEIENVYTAPENFTPDGKWIMGEAAHVKNYLVGCGMNGNSTQGAGGLGKVLADWIVDGQSPDYVFPFDIKRFGALHNNKKFLHERVKEIAGRHYTLLYPLQSEFRLARKLRCSPIYTLEEDAGAVFGEKLGFERALYFNPDNKGGASANEMPPGTFGKPEWFDYVKDEVITCRTGVGVIDLSSLTKLELFSNGTEIVPFLQTLCANDVDVPINTIVQTAMLNHHGGFENDCILVRLAENRYFMVCPTILNTRIKEWIVRHMDGSVAFNDVTSMYTVLNIVGPKSKEMMSELTNSHFNIPPFTCQNTNMGYASEIMVLGFTNAAEPGYSIFVPSEYALHMYDRLMTVGRDYGLRNVGYFAVRFLRIEKFVPFWADEMMDCNTTPYEVNRGSKVKLEKGYFLGKEALEKQKQTGVTRRLVHFTLEGHDLENDIWPWSKEPILRNGQVVGFTTSTGYSVTTDKLVCMGFVNSLPGGQPRVNNEFLMGKDVKFQIDIGTALISARASLHPPKIPVISLESTQQYSPKIRQKSL